MYEHQDWNVVVLRKHGNQSNATKETKPKQKEIPTLVSIRKLDDNKEDFHHKLISKDVSTAIIKKRLEKKLTQSDLAKQINEQASVIQDIEAGKAIYNHQVLNKIYRVLGIQGSQKNKQS